MTGPADNTRVVAERPQTRPQLRSGDVLAIAASWERCGRPAYAAACRVCSIERAISPLSSTQRALLPATGVSPPHDAGLEILPGPESQQPPKYQPCDLQVVHVISQVTTAGGRNWLAPYGSADRELRTPQLCAG
jgi:hypothetical protein